MAVGKEEKKRQDSAERKHQKLKMEGRNRKKGGPIRFRGVQKGKKRLYRRIYGCKEKTEE